MGVFLIRILKTKSWHNCGVYGCFVSAFFLFSFLLVLLSFADLVADFEYTSKSLLEEKKIVEESIRELLGKGYCSKGDLEFPTCNDNSEVEMEKSFCNFELIGSIGPYHVIYVQEEGRGWWIYSINVVKFLENGITVTASIDGPRKHEVLDPRIKDDCIFYLRLTSGCDFFRYITDNDDELKRRFPYPCGDLKDLSHIGLFEHACQLDSEGKIHSDKIIAFIPCEGWLSKEKYPAVEFKELFLLLCDPL